MKLWLDDVRKPPEGWAWAKTADEAIELLEAGEWKGTEHSTDTAPCTGCGEGVSLLRLSLFAFHLST